MSADKHYLVFSPGSVTPVRATTPSEAIALVVIAAKQQYKPWLWDNLNVEEASEGRWSVAVSQSKGKCLHRPRQPYQIKELIRTVQEVHSRMIRSPYRTK